MGGNPNLNLGNFEVQEQPPYQPPPAQPPAQYQQPYPKPGSGPEYGMSYGPPPIAPLGPPIPPPRRESPMPIIAGVFLIIVALQAFIVGGYLVTGAAVIGALESTPGMSEDVKEGVTTLLMVCGGIFIILGILILLGGIFSIARKSWGLALVGSILGLFTIGFYFTGSILSLIALIMIAISKDEFL